MGGPLVFGRLCHYSWGIFWYLPVSSEDLVSVVPLDEGSYCRTDLVGVAGLCPSSLILSSVAVAPMGVVGVPDDVFWRCCIIEVVVVFGHDSPNVARIVALREVIIGYSPHTSFSRD